MALFDGPMLPVTFSFHQIETFFGCYIQDEILHKLLFVTFVYFREIINSIFDSVKNLNVRSSSEIFSKISLSLSLCVCVCVRIRA